MALKFNISRLNPLNFYHQADTIGTTPSVTDFATFTEVYNHRDMDEDFMERNLKSWQNKVTFWQPWQQSDVLVIQILGQALGFTGTVNFYSMRIIDCKGKVIKSVVPTSPGVLASDTIWNVKMGLWDVPEGKYFVQYKFQGYFSDLDTYVISQPIHVKERHENTVLIQYKNSFNDQGLIWAYDELEMQIRIPAALVEFLPQNKNNVYFDQPMNATLISAVPYREFQLVIGQDGSYIPDWLADKIDRVLSCDSTLIDGKAYTRKQGAALDPKRIEGHPLAKWGILLNEALNEHDTLVSTEQRINLGPVPSTDLFYIKGIYVNSLTAYFNPAFEKHFTGRRNFMDYLNGHFKFNYLPGYTGNFTIDVNGDLIYATSDPAEFSILEALDLELKGVLPYGLALEVSPNGTLAFSLQRVVANANIYYATVWGNGTQQNYTSSGSGGVTQTKTYTGGKPYTAYIFCDDAKDVLISDATRDVISVKGNLPASIEEFYLASNSLRYVKNNIFLSCVGGINTINLSDNVLNTFEVNKLIMYMKEAMLTGSIPSSGTNTADLSGQTPSAPPSSDVAIQGFLSHLNSNNLTVTTD